MRRMLVMWHCKKAVTALEYGLIAGVLAVVVVTAFTTLGTGLNVVFTNIVKQIGGAG